ncbi:MAG TPA: hypothetical protein VGS17_13025 [Candidatus Limnocylindria bacterium]|nr:hypothetical protein [Candidatus Limnocylindria bacterium]
MDLHSGDSIVLGPQHPVVADAVLQGAPDSPRDAVPLALVTRVWGDVT